MLGLEWLRLVDQFRTFDWGKIKLKVENFQTLLS